MVGWKGEVEITAATYEIEEGSYIAAAKDVTELLGKDELINSMKAMTFISMFQMKV